MKNEDWENPLVTVYITTHNRADILPRAIESVLKQTYKKIEIIISDDGSTDKTSSVVKSYTDKYAKIKYIKSDSPKGANHARNMALKKAKGVFITGLDDDDCFRNDRVEMFIKHWNKKYAFICDNFHNIQGDVQFKHFRKKLRSVFSFKEQMIANEASNHIFTLTSRLIGIKGFNEKLRKYQDWDCWLRLTFKYGTFKRYNWGTYYMYHNEQIKRVSNNSTDKDALLILLKENKAIYPENYKEFIVKYRVDLCDPSFSDFFRYRTLIMWQIMAKLKIKNILGKI